MKNILVPTDFSECAENAANYAVQLAQVLKSDVKLCNAFLVPAETPIADTVVWPLETYDSIKDSVNRQLETAKRKLTAQMKDDGGSGISPHIKSIAGFGHVTDLVTDIVHKEEIALVVMGVSGAGALSRLFLGSNTDKMIETANFPLLLIPPDVTFKRIKKIALATDLNTNDLATMYSLVNFARNFDAEILIAHITDENNHSTAHKKAIDSFLNEVTCKANYHKVYYRQVKSTDVAHGLDWICEHSLSDMIVMSHGKHNIIDAFFNGSYTKKLARHVNIPLMVYPKNIKSASLTVF